MRLKRVAVSRELIEQFLTVGNKTRSLEVLKGIPAGAKLVSVDIEPNPFELLRRVDIETVWLRFEHESFPEKEEGCYPETLDILIRFALGHMLPCDSGQWLTTAHVFKVVKEMVKEQLAARDAQIKQLSAALQSQERQHETLTAEKSREMERKDAEIAILRSEVERLAKQASVLTVSLASTDRARQTFLDERDAL